MVSELAPGSILPPNHACHDLSARKINISTESAGFRSEKKISEFRVFHARYGYAVEEYKKLNFKTLFLGRNDEIRPTATIFDAAL